MFDLFYQALNERWDRNLRNDLRDIAVPSLGLAGESGEVVEHFKKHLRDGAPLNNPELLLELGDVLHYWCRLCKLAGFTPDQVMQANEEKLRARGKWR